MGKIMAKMTLRNGVDVELWARGKRAKKRIRSLEAEGLVDTGATMNMLPRELVRRLGLRVFDRITVGLADERKIEMEKAGPISLTIAGRTMMCDCLVGPPGSEPLIGQIVLEELDLIADAKRRTLTVRPESPYQATLSLK